MTNNARKILADSRAPKDEQFDAMSELQKSTMPTASDLIHGSDMAQLIEWVKHSCEQQDMYKSLKNVIPFPSKSARDKLPGMQSVYLDDNQVGVFGDYYEKPGNNWFEGMRTMVDQTPILSSVIMTRLRQVERFCRAQENGKGPGFEIRLRDRNAHVNKEEKESIHALQEFFTHCGWEKNPRVKSRLKRDDFSSFMKKLVRDSLVMDSAPIETEFKRDKSLGMDGIYAIDGATIRLCTESGYRDDPDIMALQVVQGQLRSAYTFDDLIYVPRNPRTDVLVGGYGMSETELLIKVVTNLLNAMTYNGKFFDSNSIPKGLLHLSGNYSNDDLAAFRRQWNGMVSGISNSWSMPVMVSKDQESKASFEHFGVEIDEMAFSKWMVFLTSIVCAIYGIAPDEINFESFSSRSGGLSGNDTEEKLASSKDKGLLPLLHYFENTFSDFIVADFSDKYCFRFTGLDEKDEKQKFEEDKLILTVNEMRAERGYDKITDAWGDAPLNPSLIGAWQAGQQQGQEDYGSDAEGSGMDQDGRDGKEEDQSSQDFGNNEEQDFGSGNDDDSDAADQSSEPMEKSFGLPIFTVET